MWQRIQSVFLGITILCLLISLFQPLWEGAESATRYRLYPIYLMQRTTGTPGEIFPPVYIPFCLSAILIVASLTIAIQQFRRFDNRTLQIKLGAMNSALIAAALICGVFFPRLILKTHAAMQWKYDFSLFLILAAAGCNWLAIRFIRKDEKLVRDSDRLR